MSGRRINQVNNMKLLKSLLQSESAVSLYFQRVLLLLESLEIREQKTDPKQSKVLKNARFHLNAILKTVEENRRILARKIELIMGEELPDQEPWCLVQTMSMPAWEVPSREVSGPKVPSSELARFDKENVVSAQIYNLQEEVSQITREGTTMKVAVLTMFNGLDQANPIVQIVADQLKMLLDAKNPTKVLVSDACPDSDRYGVFADDRLEWVKINNPVVWEAEGGNSDSSGKLHEDFFRHVKLVGAQLVDKLSDIDVCFVHDLLCQEEHLLNNLAVRIAQKELKNTKFIAFCHFLPGKRPAVINSPYAASYTPMPKTLYVHSTYAALTALANQYQVPEGKCRVVNYSFDVLAELTGEVRSIANQAELLSPDFLIVYPAQLSPEKQLDKVVLFAGALAKVSEKTVRILFCDFPDARTDSYNLKQEILSLGADVGLEDGAVVFTSDLGYPQGLSRKSILDLFTISNLFVCPSFSEDFGLTVFEAASRGNFLVLNEAVPALAEIGKRLNAYFMRWNARNFGFETTEHYHPSEQAYLEEHTRNIVSLMRTDNALYAKTALRQRYSPKWIWKNHLEPLMDF